MLNIYTIINFNIALKPFFRWLLSFFLIIPALLFGQADNAHKNYESYAYQEAIVQFKKQVKKSPNDGEILFKLANAYRLNGEPQKAESWFQEAVKFNNAPLCKLYYAQVLLSNHKYKEANRWFLDYSRVVGNANNFQNAKKLAEYALQLEKNGIDFKPFTIKPVPFNSSELDFSPAYFENNQIVFASNRKHDKKKFNRVDEWTHENFVDILFTTKNGEEYSKPVFFSFDLNSKYHEGPLVFTSSYDTMYFTRSDYHKKKGRGFDKNRNTRLKIYRSYKLGEEWSEVEALSFNNNEYSTCHPALYQENIMVFASDRPGGFGHMDLYVSRLENGEWTVPENLGPEINTSGNEIFPFLDENGTLFFSSDMHVGIGGLDIFSASRLSEKWVNPQNLGAPINSSKDDFGYISKYGNSEGYFTSSRSGNGDDIYSFQKDNSIRIEGIVINCENQESITEANVQLINDEVILEKRVTAIDGKFYFDVPFNEDFLLKAGKDGFSICGDCTGEKTVSTKNVKGQKVLEVELPICTKPALGSPSGRFVCGKVMNEKYNKPLPNAEVILTNLCDGEEVKTYSDESGNFRLPVEGGCDYVALGSKVKFNSRMEAFSTLDKDGNCIPLTLNLKFDESLLPPQLRSDVYLENGSILELHHIYFDLDKYDIRLDAAPDLDTLYQLLVKFPEMTGEIGAHTDSRASYAYNIQLSENRALSAKSYLVSRGISPSRLTTRGYGEIQLKNDCSDGSSCSEKQHQRNRRVEFKVTYFKGTLKSKEYEYFKK